MKAKLFMIPNSKGYVLDHTVLKDLRTSARGTVFFVATMWQPYRGMLTGVPGEVLVRWQHGEA